MLFLRSTLIASAIALLPLAITSWVGGAEKYSGAQYLAYNGTVTATVTYAGCDSQTLGPYENSYIYVGVNPPWDTNPFFFELYHLCSDCPGGIFSFTEDNVYNLDFASSAFACWDDGEPCSVGFNYGVDYKPEVVLDLTKATVNKTKVGEEDGYVVTGDEKTYIKNQTERATVNKANVAAGCYEDGISWTQTFWNDSTTWTYSVSFSNSTATASIKTEMQGSTMELALKADRITNTTWPNIELVTNDTSKPHFRYSNDSEIHFQSTYSGYWLASPNEFTSSSSTQLPTSTRAPAATGSATNSLSAGGPNSTGAADAVQVPGALVSFLLGLGGLLVF